MPRNLVTGEQARAVAAFVAKFSGSKRTEASGPASPARDCP
jgi:hypothetical protein